MAKNIFLGTITRLSYQSMLSHLCCTNLSQVENIGARPYVGQTTAIFLNKRLIAPLFSFNGYIYDAISKATPSVFKYYRVVLFEPGYNATS